DIDDYWTIGGSNGVPCVSHASWLYTSADRGTDVGQWQEADLPTPITDAINTGDAGRCAVPAAGTAPTLTIRTARRPAPPGPRAQPNATRPVRVTGSGTWTGSLSVTGSVSGTIELRSDSSSPPTTVRIDAQPGISATLLLGAAAGQTIPWLLTYDVPAGDRY